MSDQQALWNRDHAAGKHAAWSDKPRKFALEIVKNLQPGAKLLELGCGVGSDARFFAEKGFDVLATDFSEVVLEQNRARGIKDNLHFELLDITQPFPYPDGSFDAVYAHLSLHYYDDTKTREVIREIARILKPKGRLYFTCKSTRDPKFGEGDEISPNVFMRHGHIRHFFSVEYVRDITEAEFNIIHLTEAEATYAGETSAFVECWAEKTTK